MNVILNTGDIVHQFMQFDPYFSFYENGIKEVVRNAALSAGRGRMQYTTDFDAEVQWMRSLAARTIQDWEQAIDLSLEYNPQEVHAYQMGQDDIDRHAIEQVVQEIQVEVERMIFGLMNSWRYRVKPASRFGKIPEWMGDDLVVQLELPEEDDGGA